MSEKPTPFTPAWGYLGGYLLFFVGWAVGMIGALAIHQPGHSPFGGGVSGYVAVALGVVLFVLGSQVMARVGTLSGFGDPGILVTLVMTPLPAMLGMGINQLGGYLRRSEASAVRVALVGLGAFLVALAAIWLYDGYHVLAHARDFRTFLWTVALQLGVALALLPLLVTKAEVTAESASAAASA